MKNNIQCNGIFTLEGFDGNWQHGKNNIKVIQKIVSNTFIYKTIF